MIQMTKQQVIRPRMTHQQSTIDFYHDNPCVFNTSDAGTGKTRCFLDYFAEYLDKHPGSKALVLGPLSILEAAWAGDLREWQPKMRFAIAYNTNREKAFKADVDVVLTNHDAVKQLVKQPGWLEGFTHVCIDEFTAYKNKDSQRSKAMYQIASKIPYRIAMSGTPDTNGILDMWHPALIVDGGERLGKRFYSFRDKVCAPRFNGFANEWIPKESATETVAMALADINIRFKLEDCVDMPQRTERTLQVELPKAAMKAYKQLAQDKVLKTESGTVKAQHAGILVRKLLQVCTGAAYDADGNIVAVHNARYDLVLDLVQERNATVVAFNYTHERDYLVAQAEQRDLKYGVIDGSVPVKMRGEIVAAMQAGELDVVFGQPQSMSHGLTLTRAKTVIWCSPTYNAEHYVQFNARIYRKGQDSKTEIIRIAAKDTWEPHVYARLGGKVENMEALLDLLKTEVPINV